MAVLVVGLLLLVLFALVWAGPLRGALDGPLWPFGWLTLVPGFGLVLVSIGLEQVGALPDDTPITTLAFVLLVAAFVIFFWEPRWWGPRWFRDRRRPS